MKTNFILFKSCSNIAHEQQTIDSRDCELASGFLSRVQALARQWGRGNNSTAVMVCVETYGGGTVVSRHVVTVDRFGSRPCR